MWWFLKAIVTILLLACFVIFLVQNNELVGLWPITDLECFPFEKISVSIVYFVLFCLGFLCGRFSAWSAYAPVRAMLRQQKKENKALSKEHEKLNHEHEKLNQQIVSLQEEAEKNDKAKSFSLNKKIKGWFGSSSNENQ